MCQDESRQSRYAVVRQTWCNLHAIQLDPGWPDTPGEAVQLQAPTVGSPSPCLARTGCGARCDGVLDDESCGRMPTVYEAVCCRPAASCCTQCAGSRPSSPFAVQRARAALGQAGPASSDPSWGQ